MSRKRIRHDITPPSAMLCNKAAATRLSGLSVLQRGDHHVPCVRPVVNHQHGRLVDWHGVGSTIIDGERSRKQARIGWDRYQRNRDIIPLDTRSLTACWAPATGLAVSRNDTYDAFNPAES